MYRALQGIAIGEKRITKDSLIPPSILTPKAVEALLRRHIISQVQAPPLAILPGWRIRAQRLHPLGITTVTEFLEADPAAIRKALKVSPAIVERWNEEVRLWLTAAPQSG